MNRADTDSKVYIRGCGTVCAIGATQQQLAQACQEYRVAPAPFSQVTVSQVPVLPVTVSPVTAPSEQCAEPPLPYYQIGPQTLATQSSRLYDFIDHAVSQAIDDAALSSKELAHTAVFCGSTACDISDLEEHYVQDLGRDPDAMALYRSGFGILAGHVRDRFNLGGEEVSFNTACSSSANAFMTAAQMIASGRYEHAVVLGVEAANQLSIQGFNSMMLLSQTACRPFDARRDGTILGEAVSALVLSRTPCRQSQFCGEKPFYFLGGANLCDTKSVTSSNADVIAEVMRRALFNAGLHLKEVEFIKAHGTSTENNDLSEGQAMQQVFGDQVPPFSSLKPYLGHTLGACGAVELTVLLAAIQQDFVPSTPGFETMDPQINLQPLRRHMGFQEGVIMLNYFGFGGNNTSLLIGNKP
jgi:3-oxoacyl-[acyl-carrier-protein] synthase-1